MPVPSSPPPSDTLIRNTVKFHKTLNQKIWRGDAMRPEVRLRLLRAALAFYRFLDLPDLIVRDIVMTGSNAAFNYTQWSDLDVHLVVDFRQSASPRPADNFFTTKKALWSANHDVSIRGFNVELYVEDTANPANSNGLYSLLHGEWLRHAKPEPPPRADHGLIRKVEALSAEIEAICDSPEADADAIQHLFDRLRNMRRAGLAEGGEFSMENLAYKALRSLGYLDRLEDARRKSIDRTLSLEGATLLLRR